MSIRGPWVIDEAYGQFFIGEYDKVYGGVAAIVCSIPARDALRDYANLISASPELLEALVMVRDADEDCKADGLTTIPPMARSKIDKAIAKAEGR